MAEQRETAFPPKKQSARVRATPTALRRAKRWLRRLITEGDRISAARQAAGAPTKRKGASRDA